MSTEAVILVGGLGKRLRPYTDIIPKPLLPVGKRPVLEIIIKQLKSYGFKKIYLATGYGHDLIRAYFQNGTKFGVNISYLKEEKPLGTAGPLRFLNGNFKEPILVLNGDILTKLNFRNMYNFHLNHNAILTIGIKKYKHDIPYGVINIDKQKSMTLQEKPTYSCYINTGIYILDLSVIKKMPKHSAVSMTEFIGSLLEKKKKILTYKIKEFWLDIGKINDLKDVNGNFKKYGFKELE